MEISLEQIGTAQVVQPSGRIDSTAAQELQEKLTELMEGGQRFLAVDFSRTERISGAAMRVLLSVTKKLQGGGGTLVLFEMNPEVAKAFELAEFSGRFSVAGGQSEALEQLRAAAELAEAASRAAALLAVGEKRQQSGGKNR